MRRKCSRRTFNLDLSTTAYWLLKLLMYFSKANGFISKGNFSVTGPEYTDSTVNFISKHDLGLFITPPGKIPPPPLFYHFKRLFFSCLSIALIPESFLRIFFYPLKLNWKLDLTKIE